MKKYLFMSHVLLKKSKKNKKLWYNNIVTIYFYKSDDRLGNLELYVTKEILFRISRVEPRIVYSSLYIKMNLFFERKDDIMKEKHSM